MRRKWDSRAANSASEIKHAFRSKAGVDVSAANFQNMVDGSLSRFEEIMHRFGG
jgi:hypothetical protein